MNRRLTAAALIVLGAGTRILFAADPVPLMEVKSGTARVGAPLVLRANDDSEVVRESDIRVVVRFRGNQELVEPEVDGKSKAKTWRFTPGGAGAYVISTSFEPESMVRTNRLFQYEKLFVRIAPDGAGSGARARPSASAMARFGHRLEIDAMLDPSCLMVGGELPVRVKFDGSTLKDKDLTASWHPGETGATSKSSDAGAGGPTTDTARTFKFNTGENDFARIPIVGPGRWTLVVEHRPEADGARIRQGDRFVATMEFQVNPSEADAGRKVNRRDKKRGD